MDMIIFLLPIILIAGLILFGLIAKYGISGALSYIFIALVGFGIGCFIIYVMLDAVGAVK